MTRCRDLANYVSTGVTAAEFDQLDTTSGTPGSGNFLRGDKTWAAVSVTARDWMSNWEAPGNGHYTVDSYTKLLIQSDTTDGSTTFTDSSSEGATITNSGAAHVTAQNKIGTSSIYFDAGDFLTIPGDGELSFGTKAFTIDYWMKHNTGSGKRVIGQGGGTGTGTETQGQWFIRETTHTGSSVYAPFASVSYGGDSEIGAWTDIAMNDGDWHHIVLTKGDNEISPACVQMAVDGLFKGGFGNVLTTGGRTVPEDARWRDVDFGTDQALWHIGGCNFNSEDWSGWLDEIRVSVGIQRWTSNFTVF